MEAAPPSRSPFRVNLLKQEDYRELETETGAHRALEKFMGVHRYNW